MVNSIVSNNFASQLINKHVDQGTIKELETTHDLKKAEDLAAEFGGIVIPSADFQSFQVYIPEAENNISGVFQTLNNLSLKILQNSPAKLIQYISQTQKLVSQLTKNAIGSDKANFYKMIDALANLTPENQMFALYKIANINNEVDIEKPNKENVIQVLMNFLEPDFKFIADLMNAQHETVMTIIDNMIDTPEEKQRKEEEDLKRGIKEYELKEEALAVLQNKSAELSQVLA